jgi:hypothetical protein
MPKYQLNYKCRRCGKVFKDGRNSKYTNAVVALAHFVELYPVLIHICKNGIGVADIWGIEE